MRSCGMLLPIFSLPSKYGIGSFSKEAYEFVDTLAACGQTRWQILPLGPTGFGDSPYQSFSTFAGNPYFIDLEEWIQEGFLSKEECELPYGSEVGRVDYGALYETRFPLFRKGYEEWRKKKPEGFFCFLEEEKEWLEDYALFMALKEAHQGAGWWNWEDGLKLRKPEALEHQKRMLEKEIEFWKCLQYYFFKQWRGLKKYANEKGVQIIGDIPIYVALDSADSWANQSLFQLDEEGIPTKVAGCPPDGFSPTGQLWGNPLYNWKVQKETGFAWWIKRMKHCLRFYDIVRIDHFRGFDEYYAIPYGDETAERGEWEKGPGMELFQAMEKEFGKLPIVAEDLGYLTDGVRRLLKESGFPGMKVLQFAFHPGESDYLTHKYEKNAVVYTGTHDNDTLKGWLETAEEEEVKKAMAYLRSTQKGEEQIWDMICLAMRSVADTCIIPVQDYLAVGSEGRINAPATLGENWSWRMKSSRWSQELLEKIEALTWLFGRRG